MERKEFLEKAGLGAALLLLTPCLGGCSNESSPNGSTPPQSVDFSLDLTKTDYSALNAVGGVFYTQGIAIVRLSSSEFAAVSSACTHEGATVAWVQGSSRFNCPRHGSNFGSAGEVLNGPATRPLTKYKTSLTGTILRIFS